MEMELNPFFDVEMLLFLQKSPHIFLFSRYAWAQLLVCIVIERWHDGNPHENYQHENEKGFFHEQVPGICLPFDSLLLLFPVDSLPSCLIHVT